MSFFNRIVKFMTHKNKDGKTSLTKVAGTIISVAGVIVSLPAIGLAIPVELVNAAYVAIALGVKLGIDGVRNGVDKNGPVPLPSDDGK